ncbi:MAG TPA: disulfide bond formation protein B [Burkholderiales bacterium]|nr:disulfide bond formation protein B [Burkholderiales bacterium]
MISNRWFFGAGAAVCALLLSTGYYLQYFQGQDPCPLCLVQRGFYYAFGAVFLLAALHGRGTLAYSLAGFVVALGGLGVAARHVWLQHLPPEQVPACGPDLFYMLENFPLRRTLEKLLTATGQCAEVKWRFLGLSIAEWSLAWFVALAIYAAWMALRRRSAA